MGAYLQTLLDALDTVDNGIAVYDWFAALSEGGDVVSVSRDEQLWSIMNSDAGRKLFSDCRIAMQSTQAIRDSLDNLIGCSVADSFVAHDFCRPVVHACLLVKTFTCLIQLYKELSEKETRIDAISKVIKAFRGRSGTGSLGPWEPFCCATRAMSAVVGFEIVWSEPLAKRQAV